MKMSTPHNVPTHMLENPEQYITKAGKFIRAHSLDELPQIWDIFIGNMSVIGPHEALSDGFVLLYKRLDSHVGRYQWPRNKSEVKPITWRQFDWLMSGLEIEQPKAIQRRLPELQSAEKP